MASSNSIQWAFIFVGTFCVLDLIYNFGLPETNSASTKPDDVELRNVTDVAHTSNQTTDNNHNKNSTGNWTEDEEDVGNTTNPSPPASANRSASQEMNINNDSASEEHPTIENFKLKIELLKLGTFLVILVFLALFVLVKVLLKKRRMRAEQPSDEMELL